MVEDNSKIILSAGFYKSADGSFKAVLSDDSVDREDEIVGKQFLESAFDGKIVGLIDHKNSVMGQVCEWVDKKIVKSQGHNALIATPKWFMSNPNAVIIKDMLEKDGATIGLSIGAIPSDSDTVEIEGKEYKRWTKGEILEASFVAIAANKHAQIQALAKSLNLDKKNKGELTMEDEKIQDKAKEIISVMEDTKKEDVIKVLQAAEIKEEIYADLVKDISVEVQKPKGKPPKEGEDKDDPDKDKDKDKDKGGKDIDAAIEKKIDEKVAEKLKEIPIFKVQKDLFDMTDEQTKDKAAEIQKAGMLPILT